MKQLIVMAGTVLAISAGSLVSARALPALPKAPVVTADANVQQATFWRWRGDNWRWRHHHHWRRWHRGW